MTSVPHLSHQLLWSYAKAFPTKVQFNCSTIGFRSQILKLEWKKKNKKKRQNVSIHWRGVNGILYFSEISFYQVSIFRDAKKVIHFTCKMFELGLLIMNKFSLLIFILKWMLSHLLAWGFWYFSFLWQAFKTIKVQKLKDRTKLSTAGLEQERQVTVH